MKGLLEWRCSITLWFLYKKLVSLTKNFCKTRKLEVKSLKWQGNEEAEKNVQN